MALPLASVARKAASSFSATVSILDRWPTSSGYCGAMAVIDASSRSRIVGWWAPSSRILLMTRRMIRRST